MALTIDNKNIHNKLRDLVEKYFGRFHQELSGSSIDIVNSQYVFIFTTELIDCWRGKEEELISKLDEIFSESKTKKDKHDHKNEHGKSSEFLPNKTYKFKEDLSYEIL